MAVIRRAFSGLSSGTARSGDRPKKRVSPDPSVTVGRPAPRNVTRSMDRSNHTARPEQGGRDDTVE
ncbi:hypothetical protein GCM10027215_01430 [Nocardioides zeae]